MKTKQTNEKEKVNKEEKFNVNKCIKKLKYPTHEDFDRMIKSLSTKVVMMFMVLSLSFTGCKKVETRVDMEYPVQFTINAISVPQIDKTSESLHHFLGMEFAKSSSSSLVSQLEAIHVAPSEVTHIKLGINGTHDVPEIDVPMQPFSVSNPVTEDIQLAADTYELTSITLLKERTDTIPGQYIVLYSGVGAGAELAQYVNITLPVEFEIPLLGRASIPVDVLAVDDYTPDMFGWGVFAVNFTNVRTVYYFGADENMQPSIMSIQVLDADNQLVGEYVQDGTHNWLKVQYADVYGENDEYTFILVKDDISYTQTYTDTQLNEIADAQTIVLLNVQESDMAGFVEVPPLSINVNSTYSIPVAFTVTSQATGLVVFESQALEFVSQSVAPTGGSTSFDYFDNISLNDATEMYHITLNYFRKDIQGYREFNTKTATVSVATLKSTGGSISLQLMSDATVDSWLFI